LRSSRDMGHFVLSSRRFLAVFVVLVAILCCSAPAHAQGIGFQGGGTVDPEQFFVGTHFESGELMPGFRFRPGIDGGFGGGYSLATVNIEFLYSIPLKSGWALYQGGGPSIILLRQTVGSLHDTSTHAGAVFTFGFANENGFFTEFKYGTGNSPNLKFGVGYTVRKKTP
jgi:hypothetical protein